MRRTAFAIAILCALPLAAIAQDKPACGVGLPVKVLACINYPGHIVARDAAKGTWQVQCDASKQRAWVTANELRLSCTAQDAVAGPQFFAGRWELFTGGGGAYVTRGTNTRVEALDVAKAPPLTINADGSYAWQDFKTVVRGRWRALAQGEFKYASQKPPAILLINAMDGKDWQVTRATTADRDNRDRIEIERRDLGLTYSGTRLR